MYNHATPHTLHTLCILTLHTQPHSTLYFGNKRRGLFYHNATTCYWSRGVAMVVEDEFQSQHCQIIHYTNSERLEGLRCCEGLRLVERHSTSVWKSEIWYLVKPHLCPVMTKAHVVVTILEPTQQSQPHPTIHYTCIETLGGLRCSDIFESIQNTQSWCEM